ncbi:hypothetical protein [Wolbachia endosymbiont (group A) of Pogonocherus hispidulus]
MQVADTGSLTVVSSQCLTLGSSLYYAATYLKLSFLDSSVWALE